MMNKHQPLRYRISSWRQLPECRSNNSRDLRIKVTDYFQNYDLTGFKISVEHPKFGTVFAYILNASGTLVTPSNEYEDGDLSVKTLLAELKKFGFDITYKQELNIGTPQLEYLMTLKNLGYDKIRILSVVKLTGNTGKLTPKIVAFQSSVHGDWLNNAYSPKESEFVSALEAGTAANLTYMSETQNFRWDWLKDYVLSIEDIINEISRELGAPDIIVYSDDGDDYDDDNHHLHNYLAYDDYMQDDDESDDDYPYDDDEDEG